MRSCGGLLAWLLSWSLAAAETTAPPWRDAVLGLRTDATGAVWNFQENGELGRVGASAVNRGEMLLVDGSNFTAQSAYMTADGNEFLVSGQAGGEQDSLVLLRRIRLDTASGVVRYLELLRNEGSESRSVQVELRTNLNGYYQRFVSNRGRESPVALQEGETGFWLAPESKKEGDRGYAFAVEGPGAIVRPVLGSQQSYVVSVYYKLEIAPGEAAALLHAVRQAPLSSGEDAKRLAEVFFPLDLEALHQELSPAMRRRIRNVRAAQPLLTAPFFLAPPGIRQTGDSLAMSDGGELRGELRPGSIDLETPRGALHLDTGDLVAAEPAPEQALRCWLRGGEVVRGKLVRQTAKFAVAGGQEIPIHWESLKHLRRNTESEVDPSAAWVITVSGEQLRLGKDWAATPVHWRTRHGAIEAPLSHLQTIEFQGTLRLRLKDGSRVGVLGSGEGAVPLGGRFEGQTLAAEEIQGLLPPAQNAGIAPEVPLPAGSVETVSGDTLVWREDGTQLTLDTAQGRLSLPLAKLRSLERNGPRFHVTLWDGSRFPAQAAGESALTLQGACAWQVAWPDVLRLGSMGLAAGKDSGPQLTACLNKLRSDDWKTRREGETLVRSVGEAAIPWLRELRKTGDADLQHRAELLLEELDVKHHGTP